jgi:N-dimethylarginine dimethylaminohydrolase
MKINSHNEWDTLKTVLVGTVESFHPGIEMLNQSAELLHQAVTIARKAYPQWYLDEVAEDLECLCDILRNAGVTVLRPSWQESYYHFATPNWSAAGFDLYNVRDIHIIFGNTLVVSAPSSRFRLFEFYAFQDILYKHFFDTGFKWIFAPLPKLKGEYRHVLQRPLSEQENTEDEVHQQLSGGIKEVFYYLDENELIFDAANIIRLGKDILYLVSSTGNHKAAKWLAHTLGDEYKIHLTHTYRSSHLDSTILPLCEGVVLLNGFRVTESTCPEVFRNWDKIYFTDVVPVPETEIFFHEQVRLPIYQELLSMGVESHLNSMSSPWAGLNVLSISPDTVLVHDRQLPLIKTLEAKKFTVIPVQMRHCYTMLGGLHCTTLDLERNS